MYRKTRVLRSGVAGALGQLTLYTSRLCTWPINAPQAEQPFLLEFLGKMDAIARAHSSTAFPLRRRAGNGRQMTYAACSPWQSTIGQYPNS
jgi:hypothetical protein